jgi:hypothetical protein
LNQRDYINDLNERYPGSGMLKMNQLMEYTQLSRPNCTEIMRKYGKKAGRWVITKAALALWLVSKR